MKNLIEAMREDAGLTRPEFSKKYNIPKRTLEAWEWGQREAPEYVIDLLGRAVYSDREGKRPIFSVVTIGKNDEWDEGHYESYIEAIKRARDCRDHLSNEDAGVEIRIYKVDRSEEDAENYFDCNLVTF